MSNERNDLPPEEVLPPVGETASTESPTPPDLREPAPPLRLVHLMLLTTVVAALAGVYGGVSSAFEEFGGLRFNTAQRVAMGASEVLFAIVTGLGLTGTLLGFLWRRGGLTYFDQPGHYVLLGCATWAINLLAYVLADVVTGGEYASGTLALVTMPATLLSLGVALYAVVRVADNWAWRAYFALELFEIVVSMLAMVASVSMPWFASQGFGSDWLWSAWAFLDQDKGGVSGLQVIAVLAAALIDRHRDAPRHWTHWVGVLAAWGTVVAALLQYSVFELEVFGPMELTY